MVEASDTILSRLPRRDNDTHIHVTPGSVPGPNEEPYRQPLPEKPLEPKPDRVGVRELPQKPKKAPYVSPFTPN